MQSGAARLASIDLGSDCKPTPIGWAHQHPIQGMTSCRHLLLVSMVNAGEVSMVKAGEVVGKLAGTMGHPRQSVML